jgi:hypothetical protein
MATVENVKLGITDSEKAGYSIISYSYELHPSEQDCADQREFSVTAGLWGEDLLDDDLLAMDMDGHRISLAGRTPDRPVEVARSFEVETKVLDEDICGDDEVFLIVEARATGDDESTVHSRASGKSNTVIGDF